MSRLSHMGRHNQVKQSLRDVVSARFLALSGTDKVAFAACVAGNVPEWDIETHSCFLLSAGRVLPLLGYAPWPPSRGHLVRQAIAAAKAAAALS